jgi:hypothetical protein
MDVYTPTLRKKTGAKQFLGRYPTYQRIGKHTVGKGVTGRAINAEHGTDFPRSHAFDVLFFIKSVRQTDNKAKETQKNEPPSRHCASAPDAES